MRVVFTIGTAAKSGGTDVIRNLMDFCVELGNEVAIHCLDNDISNFWMVNYPQLIQLQEHEIEPDDLLIISEEFIYCAASLSYKTTKYIILNQGIGSSLASDFKRNTYTATKLLYQAALGVITNSDHTSRGVEQVFNVTPDKIHKYSLPLNEVFVPKEKENIITYMPRKNRKFGAFVVNYLCGKYLDYQFIPIINMNVNQVAELLGKSKFFLSFGGPEGLGLPPLEAAMCKCKVIGHDGYGGAEYFNAPIFYQVPFYNHLNFIQVASDVIDLGYRWDDNDQAQLDKIKHYHNMDNARKSFYNIMSDIFGGKNG